MKFHEFCEYLEKIEMISSRIEMSHLLSSLFSKLDEKEIDKVIYLLQGMLKPAYYGIDFGIGERMVLKALSLATGYTEGYVERIYKRVGDLGKAAEELVERRRQVSLFKRELSVFDVYQTFYKIASSSGEGSQQLKLKYLSELFNSSSPLEARYIARIVLSRLRLGIGDSTIIDALSLAVFSTREKKEVIERAYNLCSDLGYVASLLWKNPELVKNFKVTLFKPLRPALAERASSAEEIFRRLGKCAVEYKYDGFRMQVHKKGEEVAIFSRKLERMEKMFPDLIESIKKLPVKEIIFEGEALAFNEKLNTFYSFQETMHRRRKYGIKEASKNYPLYLYTFDLLYLNGKDLTNMPLKERRKELEKLFPFSTNLKRSHYKVVSSAKEIQAIFEEAINKKLEGIMAKDLNEKYVAGKRGFAWIKLKKSYEELDTIDAVVVGYYYGKGSRARFGFGGVLVAVYNEEKDRFETIAKVGSGFTEEEMRNFKEQLEKLKELYPFRALSYKIKPDVWVTPKIVIEVAYDEITKSPLHTCGEGEDNKGFALRFPRFVRIRDDKDIYDVTTTREIEELYYLQKKKGKTG